MSAVYELPFGPGKRFLSDGGLVAAIAGGWQVNAPLLDRVGAAVHDFEQHDVAQRAGKPADCREIKRRRSSAGLGRTIRTST